MSDQPPTPLEELHGYRREHFLKGVEYNENTIRKIVGLPLVENPEILPETPERRRQVAMEDRQAMAEIEQARKEAEAAQRAAQENERNQSIRDERLAIVEAENAELRARLEELLTGQPDREKQPEAEPESKGKKPESSARKGETPPEGVIPDSTWLFGQITAFAEKNDLPLPPKKGFGMTKTEFLNHVLSEYEKRVETA